MSYHELSFGIKFNSKIEGRKTGIFLGICSFKAHQVYMFFNMWILNDLAFDGLIVNNLIFDQSDRVLILSILSSLAGSCRACLHWLDHVNLAFIK